MFGWLQAKIQKKSIDAMRDDLTRYSESLRGCSTDELASLLIVATSIRLNMIEQRTIPSTAFDVASYSRSLDEETAALKVNKLIRLFQKQNQMSDAAGAMIWLHSIRCVQCPELRFQGRQMWAELQRGLPEVDALYDDFVKQGATLRPDVAAEANFIPVGLEPNLSQLE